MIANGRLVPQLRRRPSRQLPLIVSALLHLTLLAFLLLAFRSREPEEEYVPPAPVAMIFEHGGSPLASMPRSRLLGPPEEPHPAVPPSVPTTPPAPSSATAPSAPAAPPAPVPRQLEARASLPPPPAPAHPSRLPPAATEAEPARPPAPSQLALAVPAPSPPSPPRRVIRRPAPLGPPALAPPESLQQYSVRLPPPAEMQALLEVRRPPLPSPHRVVLRPLPLPPPSPPAPPPEPRVPPQPRYLVMNNLSYGASPQGAAAPSLRSGDLNLALNQSALQNEFGHQFSIHGDIGPDWRAELTQWVNERKYYPEQALEMDQQGAVMIHLVIERDGTVRSATLVQSSGSPFLDSAWLGLFEGARLPPFPPGTPANQITLDATMHYILVN